MHQKRIKKQIKNFLTGEYFTDALRITLSITLPAGILFGLDLQQPATGVALGALLIALTDIRGTIEDKKTTSVVSILLFFIVSLISILSFPYPFLMGAVFLLVTFGCSMLTVYGSRFSMSGTAAIVLMIFIWGLKPSGVWFCVYLLTGGIWFYAISLLHYWLLPERYLRYAISDCLLATHDYLKVKAQFYDPELPLEECYNNAMRSHYRVSEAQQQLRSILLRDKALIHSSNRKGQALLHVAEKTIDLYEQITAIHYDYSFIRTRFAITGALDLIRQMIALLTVNLHQISEIESFSKQSQHSLATDRQLAHLIARFGYIIQKEDGPNAAILSQLCANLEDIQANISEIGNALKDDTVVTIPAEPKVEYHHFVAFENFEWKRIIHHLELNSPIFRFSLRLSITCLFCYILAQLFDLGTYSYWILITVVVIIKPAFSLTRERNAQRLIGTLIGIVIALLLLLVTRSTVVQLSFCFVFLLIYFTFNRTHHLFSVIALTPVVMLILYIYSNSGWDFVLERIYDTLIGCAIAYLATYLFPSWESGRIPYLCRELLSANKRYLEKLSDVLTGKPVDLTTYKLARKNVYIEQAALSSAFQRMIGEPGNKPVASEYIYHFQMLNHILSANIASLFLSQPTEKLRPNNQEDQILVMTAIEGLSRSILFLDQHQGEVSEVLSTDFYDESNDYSSEKYHDQYYVLKATVREIKICCTDLRAILF